MLARSCLVLALVSAPGFAQCPQWSGAFGGYTGLGGPTMIVDVVTPAGHTIYANVPQPAGPGYAATRIVRWDGVDWSPIPMPALNTIDSMVSFDDGSGAKLFVSGQNAVARWDGATWSTLAGSEGGSVLRIQVVTWEGAQRLFALGRPGPLGQVAYWTGSGWQSVGGNIAILGSGSVTALASYTSVAGTHLYAGCGAPVDHSGVLRWDGTAWTSLPGISPTIRDFAVFDDGSGPALFAGGNFGGSFSGSIAYGIARWDGVSWDNLGGIADTGSSVSALQAFDDGTGPALYVAGKFLNVAGAYPWPSPGIARWRSTGWTPVGVGFQEASPYSSANVLGLAVLDVGTGPKLAAVGGLYQCDRWWTQGPALWDGASWSPLKTTGEIGGAVRVMRSFPSLGLGPALWIGGDFRSVGSAANVRGIGRFDGAQWHALDQGLDGSVFCMDVFPVGGVPQLHVGGVFNYPALAPGRGLLRWTGSQWVEVGGGVYHYSGTLGTVYAMVVHTEIAGLPPNLFVAGSFDTTGGGSFNSLARWSGSTWSSVGGGPGSGIVTSLAVFDDGSGPKLFAGGQFQTMGGVALPCIARWTGFAWTPLGSGLNGACMALAVHDDGTGPALYAGGEFTIAGGVPASRIARWRNGAWTALGEGLGGDGSTDVLTLKSMGNTLLVGGTFTTAGGLPVHNVATWANGAWSTFDSVGTTDRVLAIAPFEDGSATSPAVYLGGAFSNAGGIRSTFLAKWFDPCDLGAGTAYCLGDGAVASCPCGNDMPSGTVAGCANASGAAGTLSAEGQAVLGADTVVLRAMGLENRPMLLFQGTTRAAGGAGSAFGDGLLCAGGAIRRIAVKWSTNGNCAYPEGTEPMLSVVGVVTSSGTRTYQAWYRDPAPGFCDSALFNTTNGVEVAWSASTP